MDAFKFMCTRMLDEEDTNMLADDSQQRENCEGASKKRKISDDPLGTSHTPLTIEALPKGHSYINKLDEMVKELEDLIKSNIIPGPETMEFTSQQVAVPEQFVKSEQQGTLLDKPLQQVAVLKQTAQSVKKEILPNQPLQQLEVPIQNVQPMQQDTLQNKPLLQVAMPKQIVQPVQKNILPNQPHHQIAVAKQTVQSVRQDILQNKTFQQVAVPKQSVQLMRQGTLLNQPPQNIAVPKQTVQSVRQVTFPNQPLQQVVLPKKNVQPMQQGTLQNQPLQPITVPKQNVLSVRQGTMPNQLLQQVAVPNQTVQPMRQNILPNQPLQQVSNQFIQSVRETFVNQSVRNEVAEVEKRGPQSFEVLSWEPRAFLYHNFLSKEECEHLIKVATPHLERSLLRDRLTGNSIVSSARTSFGASLKRGFDDIISNIEKRIAEATFMPIEHGEPLHVLRYELGQKIEPHHDYFNDVKLDNPNGWGQRIATFLMYLSPVEEGGETIFPLGKGNVTSVEWRDGALQQIRRGVIVKPKMGDAVLFWSVKPDGTLDPSSLHSGCPVIKGNKWCCTKWMRAKEVRF